MFKNLDLNKKVKVYKPRVFSGKYIYIGFTRINRPGIWAGINEYGLGIVAADAHTAKKYRAKPHMANKIFKAYEHTVANCRNIKEALAFLRKFYLENITVPDLVIVADRKKAIVIEYLPKKFRTKAISKGFVVRSNHFLVQKARPKRDMSSYSRYETANTMINNNSTLKGVMNLCKNHDNGPGNSVCRHSNWRTIASAILVADKKVSCYYIINKSPCKSRYKRISL